MAPLASIDENFLKSRGSNICMGLEVPGRPFYAYGHSRLVDVQPHCERKNTYSDIPSEFEQHPPKFSSVIVRVVWDHLPSTASNIDNLLSGSGHPDLYNRRSLRIARENLLL